MFAGLSPGLPDGVVVSTPPGTPSPRLSFDDLVADYLGEGFVRKASPFNPVPMPLGLEGFAEYQGPPMPPSPDAEPAWYRRLSMPSSPD
jgi:hypothetical protein